MLVSCSGSSGSGSKDDKQKVQVKNSMSCDVENFLTKEKSKIIVVSEKKDNQITHIFNTPDNSAVGVTKGFKFRGLELENITYTSENDKLYKGESLVGKNAEKKEDTFIQVYYDAKINEFDADLITEKIAFVDGGYRVAETQVDAAFLKIDNCQ
tara:strand:- start:423 stop:884 length:462 start_codon:yes stop_codon:yes gene_type:complete